MVEEIENGSQAIWQAEDNISLDIASSNNISEGSQTGDDDAQERVRDVLQKGGEDSSINDELDSLFLSVGQVREGPGGISKNLGLITDLHHLGKNWDSYFNLLEFGEGSSSAKIGNGPSTMFDSILVFGFINNIDQITQSIVFQDHISVERTVSCDISDSPDSLLRNFSMLGSKQVNEKRNTTLIDDSLGLDGGTRSDIRQGPGSLELELELLILLDELKKNWDQTSINDNLDWGAILNGEDFSQSNNSVVLFEPVIGANAGNEFVELSQSEGFLKTAINVLLQLFIKEVFNLNNCLGRLIYDSLSSLCIRMINLLGYWLLLMVNSLSLVIVQSSKLIEEFFSLLRSNFDTHLFSSLLKITQFLLILKRLSRTLKILSSQHFTLIISIFKLSSI